MTKAMNQTNNDINGWANTKGAFFGVPNTLTQQPSGNQCVGNQNNVNCTDPLTNPNTLPQTTTPTTPTTQPQITPTNDCNQSLAGCIYEPQSVRQENYNNKKAQVEQMIPWLENPY